MTKKVAKAEPSLTPPKKFREAGWQVKIERAKEAREQTAQARQGKSAAFSVRRTSSPGQE